MDLDLDKLPDTPAIYIISRKGQFDPQYIGFSSFLRTRLKNHSVLVNFDLKDHELFYCEFDENESDEFKEFEKELIIKYQPPFNKIYVSHQKREQKIEKTRRFSNILAGASSSIALAALIFTMSGLLFTTDTSMTRSELSDKTVALDRSIQKNRELSLKLQGQLDGLKEELSAITSVPEGAAWAKDKIAIDQRLAGLESKLLDLENALTLNPAKALAVPILRKDLDNTQMIFKSELSQTRSEVNRLYDQNKWFIGLMFTIAISVLGMAVSNFIGKKDS